MNILQRNSMRIFRTGIALLSAFVLLLTFYPEKSFSEMLTNQEKLDTALDNLNNYLAGRGHEYISLQETADLFKEVYGVEEAGGFMMYTLLALSVDNPELVPYDQSLLIQALKTNTSLTYRLGSPDFQAKYSSIRSVNELEQYVYGRNAEKMRDMNAAYIYYSQCQNFYDSTERMLRLMQIIPSITPTPTPRPAPTAAPARTPAPTPTPQKNNDPLGVCQIIVKDGRARSGPGTNYDLAGYVFNGERYYVYEIVVGSTGKNWYRIVCGGISCWISSGIAKYPVY